MDLYATSAAADGQLRSCPRLGYCTGYVSNNHSAVSSLLCPRGAAEGQSRDVAVSTTAEDFVPPKSRSLLLRWVQQPGSGSRSCFPAGAASPQHMRRLRGTNPAQPGVLQKTTYGIKEQLGFARAAPKTDRVLPALPLGASVALTNDLPSARSHVGGMLPTGSERGNRFNREVPGCWGVTRLPVVGRPVPLVFGGLQAPRVTPQGGSRKEPSGFDVTPCPTLPAAAATWRWRRPALTAKFQPQRPNGFSAANPPTGLRDTGGHPPAGAPPT